MNSKQYAAFSRWTRAPIGNVETPGAPLVGALHKGTHEGCPYETRIAFLRTADGEHYG